MQLFLNRRQKTWIDTKEAGRTLHDQVSRKTRPSFKAPQ